MTQQELIESARAVALYLAFAIPAIALWALLAYTGVFQWLMLLFVVLPLAFFQLLFILIGLGKLAEWFLLWISGAKKL